MNGVFQSSTTGEKLVEHKAVQTGGDTQDLVQISVPLSELLQRITSYQRYKRFQLDINNQVEFCHHEDGSETTCARTDAACFRRSTKVRSRAGHDKEPLVKPLSLLDQFQRTLCHEQGTVWDRRHANTSTLSLLGLTERLSNIEQFLGVQGGSRPKDLLTRVAHLEMRLLAVEGQSQEYHHAKTGNKSVPTSKTW